MPHFQKIFLTIGNSGQLHVSGRRQGQIHDCLVCNVGLIKIPDAPKINHDNDGILLNYIVLESKYFIYRTKLNKTSLSFKRIKNMFQIESFIATKKSKLEIHHSKWKPLLELIEQ